MGRSVKLTRRPARTVRTRRRHVIDALAASGAPLATVYDMSQGGPVDRRFAEILVEEGLEEHLSDRWPCEASGLGEIQNIVIRGGDSAVVKIGDAVAYVDLSFGWFRVSVAGRSRDTLVDACAAFRDAYPAAYRVAADDVQVPITFWTNSVHGPIPRLRKIDSAGWDDITGNYTADVQAELADLMGWENGPGRDGQLLLWQGPPGTGKTWALRSLASSWAPWAEFHYITDPDQFFVQDPSYMVNVLLADSYDVIDDQTGDVYAEADPLGKWRVLILEDTGELLSANAKAQYGQGLSRLLNVVDGMIGQGLRVLAIVTTNDELGDLHPAVSRPGRCASQIAFGPLSAEEASEWLGESVDEGGTVAELYARRGAQTEPESLAAAAGEYPVLRSINDVAEWAATVKDADIRIEIAKVADEYHDDMVGYGETAWDSAHARVLYVSGDWTETERIDAAFLEIAGVDEVVHEAETLPDGWWDAEVVYPDDPPRWVTDPELAATDQAVSEILAELVAQDGLVDAEELRDALPAAIESLDPAALLAALEALGEAHKSTAEGIVSLVASAQRDRGAVNGDSLTAAAIAALHTAVSRPEHAAAPITVNVPEQPVTVHTAPVTVNVPEQVAPVVNVAAAEAPIVRVQLPEQQPVPPAEVHVHVPEQQPAQAPDVHVHVPPPVAAASSRPRAIRVEYDEHGNKRFVPEEIEDAGLDG